VGNKDVLNRWLHSGASALLVLGLLTGCTDAEPEPTFTPTLPDSTPSPDDGPEPDADGEPVDKREPPEIPELSDDPVEAAEQLVDYFIAAYEYGYSANNPEPLLAISHPDCGTCSMHAENMLDRRETGVTWDGGGLHVMEIEIFPLENNEALIEAEILQDAFTRYDSELNIIERAEDALLESVMVVQQEETGWKMRAIHNEVIEE